MRSCLYFIPRPHDPIADVMHKLPPLPSTCGAELILELQADTAYPASALSEVLGEHFGKPIPAPDVAEDVRCLPLADLPCEDAQLLLAAAGVDAAVRCRPLLVLRSMGEELFRTVHDRLSPARPRSLSPDAGDGFILLPPDELTARGKALGLALPENCLLVIADYYRTAEQRDPTSDELLILDAAYRAAAADAAVCAPIAFTTEDPRCHAAYADLMEKRRVLSPDANAPATLGELSGLASRYLSAHSGRPLSPRYTILAAPQNAAWRMAAMGTFPALGFADRTGENTALYGASPMAFGAPSPEERLLWVEAPHHGTQAIAAFFRSPAAPLIRRSLPVAPLGLIGALGRVLGSSGLGLCLAANETAPARLLQNEAPGILLVCDPRGGRTIPDALRSVGLKFRLIAAIEKAPVCRTADNRLRFPAAMLAPRPAIEAAVYSPRAADSAATVHPLSTLSHALQSPAAHRMDGFDPRTAPVMAQYPASVSCGGGRGVAALACVPAHDPFGEVRDAAVALIARLTAQGVSPAEITLAVTLESPPIAEDPAAAGRAIAALLAIHTVQTELGILSEPTEFVPGESFCVRLSASARIPANRPALSADARLWLAIPHSSEPHLNGQRAILSAAQHHTAAGGCLIPTEQLAPLAAAFRAALYAGFSLRPIAPPELLLTPLCGGMLFALSAPPASSDGFAWAPFAELCPLREDAVVFEDAVLSLPQALSAMRGDLPVPLPPCEQVPVLPRTSRRRIPRPRVIIPACTDGAVHLARAVVAMGGEPICLPFRADTADAAKQSITALAEGLENGHILLLGCGEAVMLSLLRHPRFADALADFRAADGLVCVWNGAFTACLSAGLFSPAGEPVTAAPLRGQRMLMNRLQATRSPWTASCPTGLRETVLLDRDPFCPVLTTTQRRALAELGCIAAEAAGTPNGCPAVTALTSPDGGVLGLVSPPSPSRLAAALDYFR